MIVLDLPKPPSTNNLFANVRRKASAGKKRRGRIRSTAYEAWRKEAGWLIQAARQRPIAGPVCVQITFGAGSRADLDNRTKAPLDALVRHRLIDGDGPATVREIHSSFSSEVAGCRIVVREWVQKS